MTAIRVEIKAVSPVHFNSGQASVNVDAEVIHDKYGMPYLPARRFKGLLAESAAELKEMGERSGITALADIDLARLFHRGESDGKVNAGTSEEVQLVVPNFYLAEPDEYRKMCAAWEKVQSRYKSLINRQDVLEEYTSIRYQTKLKDGVAQKGSLHNMRAVNPGVTFHGTVELTGEKAEQYLGFVLLAIKNVRAAGMKRNRGFGSILCRPCLDNDRDADAIAQNFLKGEEKRV